MSTITRPITYEESLTMPENRLEEIIDGESYIMPPATKRHWLLLRKLREALEDQLPRKQFWISYAEVGLGIQRDPLFTYRIPDIAVFSRAAVEADIDEAYVWTAPALIVECLSPANRRGRIEKLRQNYESIGGPELWLVDPHKRVLSVYRLEDGILKFSHEIQRGAVFAAHLPRVGVDVDELWEAFGS
ncbi:MAG: Uma2 family endonuclease [Bryobacteraceae bacterium]